MAKKRKPKAAKKGQPAQGLAAASPDIEADGMAAWGCHLLAPLAKMLLAVARRRRVHQQEERKADDQKAETPGREAPSATDEG